VTNQSVNFLKKSLFWRSKNT